MLDSQFARRRAPPEVRPGGIYTHSRSRTSSSNVFPETMAYPMPANGREYPQMQMHVVQPQHAHQRRSPSVNTFSTTSSAGGGGGMSAPSAYRTSPTSDIRRSISSRSGGTLGGSLGYVSLLRKQKATVWCDRAQYEDPRLLAQQRAAKMRANQEIVGTSGGLGTSGIGSSSGRTSTGLSSAGGKVAAKIRHHGKPVVVGYSPETNYVGVGGVPLRLSATEVEGEDSEDDEASANAAALRLHHRRTSSSGHNSIASGRRVLAYRPSSGLGVAGRRWSPSDTPERAGSLVDTGPLPNDKGADEGVEAVSGKARSFASGSSGERLDTVPDMAANAALLASNSFLNTSVTREKSGKTVDELKRRGSVDERTITLTSGRLFIANPD